MRSRTLLVVGAVVGTGLAVLAVRATADEVVAVEAAPPEGGPLGPPGVESCPYRLGDFLPVHAYAEGVTMDMVLESDRLRAEATAADAPPTPEILSRRPPSAELNMARACEAWVKERAEREGRAGRTSEVRPAAPLPDRAACSQFCDLAIRCVDSDYDGGRDACIGACLRGDHGRDYYVRRVLELGSCQGI